ncbi:hypothetical protein ACFS07_29995 [Undibacterium arcticum]
MNQEIRRPGATKTGAVIDRIESLGGAAEIVGHHVQIFDAKQIFGEAGIGRQKQVIPGLRRVCRTKR